MVLQFLPLLFDAPLAFAIISTAFVTSMLTGLIFHEFCHALVADRLGDGLPRRMGRLTLDPRRHYDPIGTTLIFFVGFGWAKPVPVNPRNAAQMAVIALAGPLSNFVMAGLVALPIKLGFVDFLTAFDPEVIALLRFRGAADAGELLGLFLGTVVLLNVLLGTFNLIPIPPLDGSRLLDLFLPPKLAYEWGRWGPGMLMLLILAPYITGGAFGLFMFLRPLVEFVLRAFVGETALRFS